MLQVNKKIITTIRNQLKRCASNYYWLNFLNSSEAIGNTLGIGVESILATRVKI